MFLVTPAFTEHPQRCRMQLSPCRYTPWSRGGPPHRLGCPYAQRKDLAQPAVRAASPRAGPNFSPRGPQILERQRGKEVYFRQEQQPTQMTRDQVH